MDSSVHTYRLQRDALQKRLRRNAMRIFLIMGCVGATAMLVVSIVMAQRGQSPYFTLAIMALSFGYVGFTLLRRKPNPEMQAAFDGYVLTLHDFAITRVYPGFPTISIPIKAIQSITRYPDGSLTIASGESDDKISVSIDIENYEDLVPRLQAITDIQEQVRWPIMAFLPAIGVLSGFVSFGLMLTTKDPVMVGILGGLVVVGGAYSFYTFRYSKQFPTSMRKTSWFTLGMIGLALYYMFMVFTGHV
jgi:hypothetical protein